MILNPIASHRPDARCKMQHPRTIIMYDICCVLIYVYIYIYIYIYLFRAYPEYHTTCTYIPKGGRFYYANDSGR